MFYTDRRTVFEYKRKDRPSDAEDTFTQFSYACHKLGIEIKTTSVPQAKGRVERLNQTLQSRLPVELRHAHITNIEDANVFLNHYIKKYNNQFALHLNSTKSVYEKQPSMEKINRTLAVLSTRTIDSGHCIRFQSKFYFPVTENGDRRFFAGKTNCMVIETFDGQLLANIDDNLYLMEEVAEHELVSKEFDTPQEAPKKEKKNIFLQWIIHGEKPALRVMSQNKSTVVAMSLS